MRSFDGSSPTAFALQKRHLITMVSFWMCDRRRCELLNMIVLGVLGLSLLLKQHDLSFGVSTFRTQAL